LRTKWPNLDRSRTHLATQTTFSTITPTIRKTTATIIPTIPTVSSTI
jgi:hypothetical protein